MFHHQPYYSQREIQPQKINDIKNLKQKRIKKDWHAEKENVSKVQNTEIKRQEDHIEMFNSQRKQIAYSDSQASFLGVASNKSGFKDESKQQRLINIIQKQKQSQMRISESHRSLINQQTNFSNMESVHGIAATTANTIAQSQSLKNLTQANFAFPSIGREKNCSQNQTSQNIELQKNGNFEQQSKDIDPTLALLLDNYKDQSRDITSKLLTLVLRLDKEQNIPYMQELMLQEVERLQILHDQKDSFCRDLMFQLDQLKNENLQLRTVQEETKINNIKLMKRKEREFAKTQKRYERSMGKIQNQYEKNSRTYCSQLNDLELITKELIQTREKIGFKRENQMRTVEEDLIQEGLITNRALGKKKNSHSLEREMTITESGKVNISRVVKKIIGQNQHQLQSAQAQNDKVDLNFGHQDSQRIENDQFEATSKYNIPQSNRYPQEQTSARGSIPVYLMNQGILYLEKTTPRSGRQNYQPQVQSQITNFGNYQNSNEQSNLKSHQPKSMISNYAKVPRLPLNNINSNSGLNQVKNKQSQIKVPLNKSKGSQKEKSVEITTSIDLSHINKKDSELSTNIKQHLCESANQNDESVCAAPAFIIGEKEPEWDSFLDDTKVELFRQVYALQHKIDPSLLKSPPRQQDCLTPNSKRHVLGPKYEDEMQTEQKNPQKSRNKQNLINQGFDQNSQIFRSFHSIQKSNQKRRVMVDSSQKKYKFTDVKLHEMLDVSNAIVTQSPLPSLPTEEKQNHRCLTIQKQLQDVQLDDIINAGSLSISLKTATDAGAFQNEDQNVSMLRGSDIQRSGLKFQFNTNTTHGCNEFLEQEQDSLFMDRNLLASNDQRQQAFSSQSHTKSKSMSQFQTVSMFGTGAQENRGFIRNMNKEVFNIIDEHNNNGELTSVNLILEESNSSYSKTGTLNLQQTLMKTYHSNSSDIFNLNLPQESRDKLQHNQHSQENPNQHILQHHESYSQYKDQAIEDIDKSNSSQKPMNFQTICHSSNQNNEQPSQFESFKSTVVMKALGENKRCLEGLQNSCSQSQIPTPAFSYKQSSQEYDTQDIKNENDRSLNLQQPSISRQGSENQNQIGLFQNRRSSNYLLQNHKKLIERVSSKYAQNSSNKNQPCFQNVNQESKDSLELQINQPYNNEYFSSIEIPYVEKIQPNPKNENCLNDFHSHRKQSGVQYISRDMIKQLAPRCNSASSNSFVGQLNLKTNLKTSAKIMIKTNNNASNQSLSISNLSFIQNNIDNSQILSSKAQVTPTVFQKSKITLRLPLKKGSNQASLKNLSIVNKSSVLDQ